MNTNISESQMQSRLRRSDKHALESVYIENKTAFLNYASGFKIDKGAALDIYQDSIVAMYQNFVMNQLVLEKSSIKTYLFGIGKYKIYKYLNNEKRMITPKADALDFEEIQLEEDLPTETQIKLSQNLKLISESCQLILKLFYYRGLTIDEIVEQTEYKDPNTVRSHKSRCLKRLKTLFKVQ
ncbi:RNA polymerase sigma factor [Psychroserpens ponticola]|uniref:Sigma-70 family RNA polymerase sigma factor n=1 Tax=Psychroserpens ponticola TaxID=2932268 RepID=A0ABY7RY00_9FLAO|nr:sigma-70 family RNA polymerase sigma factor [Psychroserpens ponticola]WCO01989.1 sigma-70 family RNA polymerase sigma factor [Psychroserpens ponticola]